MNIRIDNLAVAFDGTDVFAGVSCTIAEGDRWALIGRNGTGKSTLVRCLAGLFVPTRGAVLLDKVPVAQVPRTSFAKRVAYVPQALGRIIPYRVRDYVMMGRFPHQGFYAVATVRDRAVVEESLALTGSLSVAGRTMDTLSGGELQRVLIAGAVAQEPQLLLLDEPTTFLDPLHCELIHAALARIHDEKGTTLVSVTHDIDTAFNQYSHICALAEGTSVFNGPIDSIDNRAALLSRVFGLRFDEARTGLGRSVLVPVGVEP